MWKIINDIGQIGSENGIIIKDEEYKDFCRVTLEKCEKYCAITSGVYGAMLHTTFCGFSDREKLYKEIKNELQKFIDADTNKEEGERFYDWFVSKY